MLYWAYSGKKKKSVGFTCDQYTGFDDFEP